MTHGSEPKACGSRLMAEKGARGLHRDLGPGPALEPAPSAPYLAMNPEPGALSHEPSALNSEPTHVFSLKALHLLSRLPPALLFCKKRNVVPEKRNDLHGLYKL